MDAYEQRLAAIWMDEDGDEAEPVECDHLDSSEQERH